MGDVGIDHGLICVVQQRNQSHSYNFSLGNNIFLKDELYSGVCKEMGCLRDSFPHSFNNQAMSANSTKVVMQKMGHKGV